jgi:hypothetical protein
MHESASPRTPVASFAERWAPSLGSPRAASLMGLFTLVAALAWLAMHSALLIGVSEYPAPHAAVSARSVSRGGASTPYRVQDRNAVVGAVNPSQHLAIRFSPEGVVVRSDGVTLRLRLQAYGFGAVRTRAGSATATTAGSRAFYSRDLIQEWYRNRPEGLEQGFTIQRAPVGDSRHALTLVTFVSSNGSLALSRDRKSLNVERRGGGRSLQYGHLAVSDAGGHRLRSWFELRGKRLFTRIDALHAASDSTPQRRDWGQLGWLKCRTLGRRQYGCGGRLRRRGPDRRRVDFHTHRPNVETTWPEADGHRRGA